MPFRQAPVDWMSGPKLDLFREAMQDARTIVWNGPMGVFEIDQTARGTLSIPGFDRDLCLSNRPAD
jgi:phosphoglycerate kinase